MITALTWNNVVAELAGRPPQTRLLLAKGVLPHPKAAGMRPSAGLPEGQIADYRHRFTDGSGLHVQDFGDHYEAHLDKVHPETDFLQHLREDAPGVLVGGAAAAGATAGGLIGGTWKAALVGAAIAGIVGILLAARRDL